MLKVDFDYLLAREVLGVAKKATQHTPASMQVPEILCRDFAAYLIGTLRGADNDIANEVATILGMPHLVREEESNHA
jgi:hypothetical protein